MFFCPTLPRCTILCSKVKFFSFYVIKVKRMWRAAFYSNDPWCAYTKISCKIADCRSTGTEDAGGFSSTSGRYGADTHIQFDFP